MKVGDFCGKQTQNDNVYNNLLQVKKVKRTIVIMIRHIVRDQSCTILKVEE